MANTHYMINITQCKLKKFIDQYITSICKPKQRMICKHSPQPHRPRMQDSFMTHAAHACMAMNDLYLLPYNDIAEDGEKREDRRKGTGAEHDEEWDMVDFEAIRKISDTGSILVRVRDDYNFVSSVDELRRELIDVTFDSSWLWKEEVANHGNVIRHCDNNWKGTVEDQHQLVGQRNASANQKRINYSRRRTSMLTIASEIWKLDSSRSFGLDFQGLSALHAIL